MKYLNRSWEEEDQGVLLFFQRLQEMLFHYSDDIVKAPVHNSETLILEYLETELDESIPRYHLDHIADELCDSLKKDYILKERLGQDNIKHLISTLKKSQKKVIEYLSHTVPFSEYYELTCQYLLEKIKQPKEKTKIEFAIRAWISSAVYQGYRSEYIYYCLTTVLRKKAIECPFDAAKDFVESFNFKKKNYSVYINIHNNLAPYKQLLAQRLDVIFEDDGNFKKIKSNDYFVGKVIEEEVDPFNAIDKAYNRLNIFFSFYRVISNRNETLFDNKALVICDALRMKLPVVTEGFKSIAVEPSTNLESAIDNSVFGCQNKPAAYSHLRKMIKLHNMALTQSDVSDGFLNLWSILEVATRNTSTDSTIKKVISNILPILQNDYFAKIFSSIHDDLKDNLLRTEMKELLRKISSENDDLSKIIALVFLPQYEELRDELFIMLTNYPIIRQKIYKLYSLKNDKNKLLKSSASYRKRIEWHLYRLYRVRNAIVHAGETDRYIRILGEHLHIYCDSVINEIMVKLTKMDSLETVEDVFIDTGMLLAQKIEYLSKGGAFEEKDIPILIEDFSFHKNLPR